jgi:hypothetical protein
LLARGASESNEAITVTRSQYAKGDPVVSDLDRKRSGI